MLGQHRTLLQEQKVSKFIELSDGYKMESNDGTIRILLRHITVMDGAIESGFYSTKTWIKESEGWIEVNNIQNYRNKEDFIKAISESEDFTEAIKEYRFNNKNNNEL